ncbi:MAG TPA: ABC transporter permease [Stellaceae bacterium]|nr:ABC transporter permease [Stellaceae bacterium]
MTAYLLRRGLVCLPTLLIVTVIVFLLQVLLPGDPALALAGEDRDPAVIAFIRQEYHLDQPLPVQYAYWIGGVVRGDLGQSIKTKTPVTELIAEKLPVTVELSCLAMLFAVAIGIPAGVVSAVRRGSVWDWVANAVGLFGLSIPSFWLGIMLILVVSVDLGWLPASGYVSPFEDPLQNLRSMIMPAFVLGAASAAVMMRHTRGAMLSAMRADYVRTARAKGLVERVVVVRHGLRNALIPVITLGALELGQLLSGAVLTEQVFTIPGFGKLIVDAVFTRDYAVVQGVVLFTATAYLLLNLAADLLYFAVNPRLRAEVG